jgi:branched-chain amino acid transport system permease protein
VDEFLTATVRGLAQGALFGMLGLGYVIIYTSTRVVNFAQPALMTLGAYWTSYFAISLGLPFCLALPIAIVVTALIGALVERIAMRPMVGEPALAATMVTVGVFIVLQVIAADLVGPELRQVGDPWGLGRVQVEGVVVFYTDIATLAFLLLSVVLLTAFLKWSRAGLGMRATASDQETALAQGVPVGRMFNLSWAISGALAAVAGVLVGTGGAGFDQNTTFVALKAIPAVVIGGLDSVRGAVVGGFLVGLAESYTKAYQPEFLPWLGSNFDQVVPYVLMLLVLLIRPYGLFGTREVERV